MERKNTILLTVIAIATLLVAVVGATLLILQHQLVQMKIMEEQERLQLKVKQQQLLLWI